MLGHKTNLHKFNKNQKDGSADKGTDDLDSISRIHMAEGKNWFLKVILGPSLSHIRTHTHTQIHTKLIRLKKNHIFSNHNRMRLEFNRELRTSERHRN